MSPSRTAPVLDAYREAGSRAEVDVFRVWCDHCHVFHEHGDLNGHRVAHCGCRSSPYADVGYILHEVGPFTRAVKTSHPEAKRIRSTNERLGLLACGCGRRT